MTVYELEIKHFDWSRIHVMGGYAQDIPIALLQLLNLQSSEEEAEQAYWRLENHVVVQQQVFEAAEPVVSILIAALINLPSETEKMKGSIYQVKTYAMELLYQIISGVPDREEVERNNKDLVERCKSKAREGLYYFYGELLKGDSDLPLWILNILDTDKDRFKFYISHLPENYAYKKEVEQLNTR